MATRPIEAELDVLIVGAGLSGIGAGVHLTTSCPDKRFAILEMRDAIGGTWDLFRYPGIRSDSDMYTLGYRHKPWTHPDAIADGTTIREYIQETAREHGVDRAIRFRHRVLDLEWKSDEGRWHVRVEKLDSGEVVTFVSRFVLACSGYYRYEAGYEPHFEGRESFAGPIVHPQHWPEDLDYAGKRIVVIGSGATAVTLVPALAEKAAHVTMLQRSPTYVASIPKRGAIERLRGKLSDRTLYRISRVARVAMAMGVYSFARRYPERARAFLVGNAKKALGPDFDMTHFSPRYDPWDQRLCAVPDGDLFEVLRDGRASVVTDEIERFTENGVLLASGRELQADILVTATGLVLQLFGGAAIRVDGVPVDITQRRVYKGCMLEGVPNAAMVVGYTNSSWTLKADLILDLFCRMLNRMEETGATVFTPRPDASVGDGGPLMKLSSGYVKRGIGAMPRQGTESPWKLYQNYVLDYALMKLRPVEDRGLVFTRPAPQRSAAAKSGPTTVRAEATA
ncbi:MAG: flavin-containing monooxygenase [Sandaracinaceae bacterium]